METLGVILRGDWVLCVEPAYQSWNKVLFPVAKNAVSMDVQPKSFPNDRKLPCTSVMVNEQYIPSIGESWDRLYIQGADDPCNWACASCSPIF